MKLLKSILLIILFLSPYCYSGIIVNVKADDILYFSDEFNEPILDTSKWEPFENGGTININAGLLNLTSIPYNNFPYIRSKYDPFPESGDYYLETKIQFPVITAFGVGFLTGLQAPPNEIPFNDPILDRIFTYHTDTSQPTFWFRYLFEDIFNPIAQRDNNFHIIGVDYTNGIYKYLFDNQEIFTIESTYRPHAIFFGSPHNMKVLNRDTPWTSITLDYIRVYASPSATPTPSPTPTPTPPPVSKVLLTPGLGASWNTDAILNCKTENYKGNWKLFPLAESIYNPILSEITKSGFLPKAFYYDWRKQATETASLLSDYINGYSQQGEKSYAVGHSMGGLVERAYVEKEKELSKFEKFITVGSPHQGTALSYPAWSGGDIWVDDLVMKIAMTTVLKLCGDSNLRKTIQRVIPSAQNLLPTTNYLRDILTGQLKPVSGMHAQNNWLPNNNFNYPFYGIPVGTLAGTNFNTLQVIGVKEPGILDKLLGNWEDGKPANKEYVTTGDGTVLTESSHVPGAVNQTISKNHNALIATDEGIHAIFDFLGIPYAKKPSQTVFTDPKSALLLIGYPAGLKVTDPSGKIIKSTDSVAGFINPKTGTYTVSINPASPSTRFIVAQFLTNNTTLWKEYTFSGTKPITKTLTFDPQNPKEDILK